MSFYPTVGIVFYTEMRSNMAPNQGRKKTSTYRKSNSGSSSARRRTSGNSRAKSHRTSEPMDQAIRNEILLIVFLALAIILFLCNFGIVGEVGNAVSNFLFGIFGLPAYIAPVIFFFAVAFGMSNAGNFIATRKLIAGGVLFLIVGMICELVSNDLSAVQSYQIGEIYTRCSKAHKGGGILAGSIAYASYRLLGMVGTVLALCVLTIICLVIVTEKSFIGGISRQGRKVYERSVEDAAYRREKAMERRAAMEERRQQEQERRRQKEEEKENEKILRMERKVSGVMYDTALHREERESAEKVRDDVHEITLNPEMEEVDERPAPKPKAPQSYHYIENESDEMSEIHIEQEDIPVPVEEEPDLYPDIQPTIHKDGVTLSGKPEESYSREMGNQMAANSDRVRPVAARKEKPASETAMETKQEIQPQHSTGNGTPKPYRFPSYELLTKGKGKGGGDSSRELKDTAARLQQTLNTFGVKVTITDISQGPTVTRYELQPEQGVKVSKIVGLADDIKLNLAATDIRIEAPIPGKAAVGIEVPNKENTAVAFRDLVESKEFREFPSKLAFAVGKDIGGQIIVTDIAKMPHMLIAGATGSGKSVCINTIIMGILYKARPDEVKMIMIDPKVVELSVYNGIPHLLIPVVTDPKKAAAALHWGVAEMTERYKKFADLNVRDLKGYNKKVESMRAAGEPDAPEILPQIVIIVDELADLMMVSPGEVEESICRLAQLARACGIHLIIATQRPSVDVITGLIKANMPSRVAFAVSSGVDSRTILDMVGAEKLLGKGDMLFYPQGYPKPARIQGAFVSDKEVSDVVDFLKNQAIGNVYSEDIEEKIKNLGGSSDSAASGEGGSEYDQYFADAGRFIIEKDKASIGMLQRVFKIGFNRAARIMDQLCEAGVVGEEEGTKPRKVLMSAEEFEQFVEETI